MSSVRFTAVLSAVLLLLAITSACFITNCPPGGKRSSRTALGSQTDTVRQCARCGPGLSGRCFGARICCSARQGCLLGGTLEPLLPCLTESLYSTPCHNHVAPCGPAGDGQCAAPGVCCHHDSCHVDLKCKEQRSEDISADDTAMDIPRVSFYNN